MAMKAGNPAQLLLLPGLICDETVWAAQVSALGAHRPLAVHGYGNARSLVSMAESVLELAPECFALAGHSMGARVALEVLRLAPGRVERLALLDTGVHPLAPGEKEKRLALFELGRVKGMEALVGSWLPPMVHPDIRSNHALMRRLKSMCISAGLEQFENQMTALIGRPDARSLLGDIRCPTLVGVGSDDVWSPIEQHREIVAAIPDAELVIFEHAGHMAPVEAPEQVSEAMRRWLAKPLAD